MNYRVQFRSREGFALPTILIASVVMMTVLLLTLQASISVRKSLLAVYYNKLAQEAAEAGLAKARYCLAQNSNVATWSAASPLRPNTTCNGGTACTNTDACFVLNTSTIRTSFSVGASDATTGQIASQGTVELKGATTAQVYDSYSQTLATAQSYVLPIKVYGGQSDTYVLGSDQQVYGFGRNNRGQLGDNNGLTDRTTMVRFQLPNGVNAIDLATNPFQNASNINSQSTAVLGSDGNIYIAGDCTYGQTGEGSSGATCYKSKPVKTIMPGGVTAKSVTHDGSSIGWIGSDGNVYSQGLNSSGNLGDGTVTDRSQPVKMSLPAGWPAKKLVAGNAAFFALVCQTPSSTNCQVYSTGSNRTGALGNNTVSAGGTNRTTTPKVFMLPGGVYAKDVVATVLDQGLDYGASTYVLGSDGNVYAAGTNNLRGQTGLYATNIKVGNNANTKVCLNGDSATMGSAKTVVNLQSCSKNDYQGWSYYSDHTLRNYYSGKCLDNNGGSTADGNTYQLYACNGSTSQQWYIDRSGINYVIRNVGTGKCLTTTGGSLAVGTATVQIGCSSSSPAPSKIRDDLTGRNGPWTPMALPLPDGVSTVTKIFASQFQNQLMIIGDDGQAYSIGDNTKGQVGNGTILPTSTFQRFSLPAGVKAVDVRVMSMTSYVLGDDGNLYGAGTNVNGQLGNCGFGYGRTQPFASLTETYGVNGANLAGKSLPAYANFYLGDTTNSGYDDLIAADSSGKLWLHKNLNVKGTPEDPINFDTTAVQIGSSGWVFGDKMWVGDLNGDGYADILALDASGNVRQYINNKTASPYSSSTIIVNPAVKNWNGYQKVMLGDIDGDGYADVMALDSTGTLWEYINNKTSTPFGDGGNSYRVSVANDWPPSALAANVEPNKSAGMYAQMFLTDLDGDGHADIVAITSPTVNGPSGYQGEMYIYRYQKFGYAQYTWGSPSSRWVGWGWKFGIQTFGDVAGDGRSRAIISAKNTASAPSWYLNVYGVNAGVAQFTLSGSLSVQALPQMGTYSMGVLASDGNYYGAGANNYGQLGDGTQTDQNCPVRMQLNPPSYIIF